MATKVTVTDSSGVPYTASTAEKANALMAKKSSSSSSKTVSTNSSPPSRGQAGWIDPIRAPGDTKFTDKYGTPTQQELNDANAPGIQPTPAGTPQQQTQQTQQPVAPSLTQATPPVAPTSPATTAPPPVATPAAAPTPTENKYAQAFNAANASGIPAPQDGGAARVQAASYMPQAQQDTTQVDNYLSQDPVINTLMSNISQLLSPKNQVSSLMDDYNKLYKQSGLADINQEIIDADTVINGTESDIRNEIQTAGGMGTESQVQAMTLARNKSLLTRYNQLVQMKTDATNQLNTLMSLDSQDKQLAQTRINSQIDAMFNMANFRQTALNNTRQQYQWMSEQMGADGLYNSLAQDPRQLAFAEQILGLSQGGLQKVAVQAAQKRALDTAQQQAQLEATRASTSAAYSTIAKNNYEMQGNAQKAAQAQLQGVQSADNTLTAVKTAQKQVNATTAGPLAGLTGWTGLNAGKNNLEATINTIKSNLAFSELQKMRDNSPTGGALGQVSEGEEKLLSSTVASLDTSQSPKQLQKNLQLVQDHYVNYLTSLGYGYDESTGTIITP